MNKILVPLFALILFGNLYSYSEQLGSIEIQIKDWNGDLIDSSGTVVVINQNSKTVFKTVNLETNPQTIYEIPMGQSYSFNVIRNDINIQTSEKIILDSTLKKIDLKIPNEGGMKFNVFYNDRYTPINNAKVTIKSPNENSLVDTITNNGGQTPRFWLQSTTPDEFYSVEISLGEDILYIRTPVRNFPGIASDFKIVTPWPSIIDKRITINLVEENQKLITDYKLFVTQLLDNNNKLISEAKFNQRGEAYFSNIPVGEYVIKALMKSESIDNEFEEWGSIKIGLTGTQDIIKIFNEKSSSKINNSCNCVAFRLDDVQDYYLNEIQKEIFNVFKEKELPLTIGVIGGIIGSDLGLVEAIKENLQADNSILEIASHSWNNVPLPTLTIEKQNSMIQLANDAIEETFGVIPTVFIPPENKFDEDTLKILKDNDFTHISSSFNYDFPPYPLKDSSFYHFPQGAQTAVFDADSNLWLIENRDKIFDDVISSIEKNGFTVVMMHPPDFAQNDNEIYRNVVNDDNVNELRLLIDEIKNSGISVVPISKINLDKPIKGNEKSSNQRCNCVAFSLSGLQDYWLNDVQIGIINTFKKTNTELTVGIIANHFGSDEKLVESISLSQQERYEIGLANNGWNYEDFSILNLNEQSTLLNQANEKISIILGVKPNIFFPPFDMLNQVTPIALEQNSIDYISTSVLESPPPYSFEDITLQRIPYGATTGEYDSSIKHSIGIPHEDSFLKIEENINNHNFVVVRLNPTEFALIENGEIQNKINSEQIKELELLIEKIKDSGYQIVSIHEIPSLMSNNIIEIPVWIKNNALWWADNKISESDFVSGIEFMITNGIILIPNIPEANAEVESAVPSWIKNSAGWWGEGLISDADFISGIEYLIKNGIIRA